MDKIVDYLKQLELSDTEAKLYLALLKSGVTGVKELAEKVDVKRTTAYFYIDQLIEKNLIIKVVKGSKKQIAPVDPKEGLEELVKQKIQSAQQTKEQFNTMLQTITALNPKVQDSQDSEIKYYKGKLGVKKIYEEAVQSKELRSYANLSEIEENFPENFELFGNALKKNTTIKMYEIYEDSPLSRKTLAEEKKNDRYFYKFLPNSMKFVAQDILIYNNNVAIINLKKDEINGIILHNTDLYNNFKAIFDFMWETLPDVVIK